MSTLTLGVCLALAASLAPGTEPAPAAASLPSGAVFVPVQAFALAWTHSIEKTRWQEDYRVLRDGQGTPRLRLEQARIQGSGAGMEPPADAVLKNGWYHYRPAVLPLGLLRLTRSPHTPDYDWCDNTAGPNETCRPLEQWLPSDGGITLLWPCLGPQS